jgi:hypothetical protein
MATVQMDQALADTMVEKAILFCAGKKFTGDTEQTRQALRKGRCDACEYLSYSLVRQVGEYLGSMDRTVKAVYAFKPDRAPLSQQDGNVTAGRRASGINLVAWVDRKSAALSALGTTLETVLSESRRKIGCVNATPACCNFNMQMVDDKEVQEGRGYGAIVQSMYVRSIQVWTRLEKEDAAYPNYAEGIKLPGADERAALLDDVISFNPELAPEEALFEQALAIERMPASERGPLEHRLQEERVVLIRRMISDQLAYINIAKEWFTVAELVDIRKRKIGYGKIGGKAAGLLLAARILNTLGDETLKASLFIPESYFLGSDLIYVFMSANDLTHWNDQKYKPAEQIFADFTRIREEFQAGEFPPDILEKLQTMLDEIGPHPIIVRSSSQLEDNFGTSFAGKYDSYFCPNQGTPAENLRALTQAISLTYASTLKPDALLYRRSKGLQDYDERMAVLIQAVQGERFGRYYLPHGAGVAFSRNLYRWSPKIKREEGFARMVWGLGTRAVERVGNDFPHLVALGHPNLQPDDSAEAIRHYSQQFVDLIDLEENKLKTLPIHTVLKPNYPALRYLVEVEQEGFFTPLRVRLPEAEIPRLAITFKECLRRTPFAARLSEILHILEEKYHGAVDLEFTFQISNADTLQPNIVISLLQCRPQSHLKSGIGPCPPKEFPLDRVVFASNFIVPQGYVQGIRYVLFVPPEAYFKLPTIEARNALGRVIGRLNAEMESKAYICIGPGRWGTANADLGIYICYSDIFNAAALVELSGEGIGPAPEPSLGTHFFQDLMEAQIFPLAIFLDQPDTVFKRDFFYNSPNCIDKFVPVDEAQLDCVRLIDVAACCPGHHLELVMDDEKSLATAFLEPDKT